MSAKARCRFSTTRSHAIGRTASRLSRRVNWLRYTADKRVMELFLLMDIHFRRQMMCLTLFLSLSAFCCGNVVENARARRAADVSGVGQGKRNVQLKKYHVMPQIVNLGRELLRINVQKNSVECSQNGGRSWVTRCSNSSYGTFRDLLVYGNELLACTSKGVYAVSYTHLRAHET